MNVRIHVLLAILAIAGVPQAIASPAIPVKPLVNAIERWITKGGSELRTYRRGAPGLSRQEFDEILRGQVALPGGTKRDEFEYVTARIIDAQVNPSPMLLLPSGGYGSVDWEKEPSPTTYILQSTIRLLRPDDVDASYYQNLTNQAIYYGNARPKAPAHLQQRRGWRGRNRRIPPPELTARGWHLDQYLRKAFSQYKSLSKEVLESEDFVWALQPWSQSKLVNVVRQATGQGPSADLAQACARPVVREALRKAERTTERRVTSVYTPERAKFGETAQAFVEGYASTVIGTYRDALASAVGGIPEVVNRLATTVSVENGVVSVKIAEPCGDEVAVQIRSYEEVVLAFGDTQFLRMPELFGLIQRVAREELSYQP